ncbi:MAG: prepilin peptidase [Geminicoccaceae bacterium]
MVGAMKTEVLTAVIAAPVVGSFLGLVIDRLPAGRPIIAGRSVCDGCGRVLHWLDLIPLFSFLLWRGRCRVCGCRLTVFYLVIELAAAGVVVSAALVLSGELFWVSLGLGWLLLVLAVIDQRQLILPDRLTLPLIPTGLGVAYLIDPALLDAHVIGAIVGMIAFTLIAIIYRALRGHEGLGMGDAKLLAGVGAWLGWAALPGVVLLAAFTALSFGVLQLVTDEKADVRGEIPFGPHLAFAFWASWLLGPLMLV